MKKEYKMETFIFPHRVVELSLHSIIISRLQSWKQSSFCVFDFFLLSSFVRQFCVFKWHISCESLEISSLGSHIRLWHQFREAIIANGILNASDFNLFSLYLWLCLSLTSLECKSTEICPLHKCLEMICISTFQHSLLAFVCLTRKK